MPRIGIFYGFSLIQILTALSIICIALFAAVPTFIDLYQQYHLSTTIQNLYYEIQYARSEAIKNNATLYVNFQTGDNWCYGINSGSTCNCTVLNSCSFVQNAAKQSQDLTLSISGISSSSLQFEGTHGAANANATITFTIYGQTKALSLKINRLGNLVVCSSTLSGYPSCA